MHRRWIFGGLLIALLVVSTPASAQTAEPDTLKVALDTIWVLVTAFPVFWMNAGFACLEAGLCRAKNAVNILAKNFIVFAASSIAFWVLGFGLMFGDGSDHGYGMTGWMLAAPDNSPATGDAYMGAFGALNWNGVPLYAKFFFQLVFAGTAATIVSGAVAERIKFMSFIVFSFVLVNGVFGTLAVGLFASDGGLFFGGGMAKTLTQLTGVVAVGVVTVALSAVAWLALKLTVGVRVSAEEEAEGLDIGEHGMDAYPGFVPTPDARAEVI